MAKRRRRYLVGFLPRCWHGLLTTIRWALRHPQPFLHMGVLGVALWALWAYAQRCDAFRVVEVSLPEHASFTLPASIIGTNLWRLDLHKLSEALEAQQPWLKEVRVIRRLPNGVRIEPIARIPVAQVRVDLPAATAAQAGRWPPHLPLGPEGRYPPSAERQVGGWYPVDAQGFILPPAISEDAGRLIRLVGVRAGTGLKVGKRNTDGQLTLALRVLETLRHAQAPVSQHVSEIEVGDPQAIRLVLDEDTEVRCGSEEQLAAQLERLRAALKIITKQQLAVRYIDVRFPEPVIGPRTS